MRLTIVGLGVVGVSLGLALKEATGEIAITGHDADPERVSRARKVGAIDASHWNLPSACEDADLVVLDLPFDELETTLRALSGALMSGAVLLDTAPLKAPVMRLARELLPDDVHLFGGHVVLATVGLGVAEPSAELLRGAPFFLVVPEGASENAVEVATSFITAVGAEPRFVGALEHDGLVAATEQLPLLAALGLIDMAHTSAGRRDRAGFVGGWLRAGAAALVDAPGHPADALLANRENLLPWVEAYIQDLERVRALLSQGCTHDLSALLSEARTVAVAWLKGTGEGAGAVRRGRQDVGFWRNLFLGGWRPRG